MDGIFRKEDRELHGQLCFLYSLRPQIESKQQNLLIKSVFLTRFIRIACLHRLQHQPEIAIARKILAGILPDLQPLEADGGMRKMLAETSDFSGNRLN